MEFFSYNVRLGEFAGTLAADAGRFYERRTIEDGGGDSFYDKLESWGRMISDWFASITGADESDEIIITGRVPDGVNAGGGNRVVFWKDGVVSLYDSDGNHIAILTPTTKDNAQFILHSQDSKVDVQVGYRGATGSVGVTPGSSSDQYFLVTPGTGR